MHFERMSKGDKIKKTKLACNKCRERKRKCDGQKPICKACLKSNLVCEYFHNLDRRRPYTKAYVESLQERIHLLETQLSNKEKDYERRTSINLGSSSLSPCSQDIKRPDVLPEVEKSNEINIEELLEAHGKFKDMRNGTYRYYGPRSTVSFISNDMPLINIDYTVRNKASYQVPKVGTDIENEQFLYQLYFSFQNSTLFLVWEDLFYEQLQLSESERNPMFISASLQYAILAVGSLLEHKNVDKFSIASEYARRGRELLDKELSRPLVSTVQTCGILSIFYMFINEDSLAWHFIGSAVSTMYSLGLNIGGCIEAGGIYFSEEEVQLRQITLWGVYLLERALNNILGRPTFMKPGSITSMVPSELGIPEYEQWHNPNQLVLPHQNMKTIHTRYFSLITYTIELLIITSKPLDQIYLSFKPCAPAELQFFVNKADIELLNFERTLPEYLRLSHMLSLNNQETISPGIFVFQLKFQYIHILLHRIFFIRHLDMHDQVTDDQIVSHKKVCYNSALNIAKITLLYEKNAGFDGFDFSTPDIICTAAIILLYFIKHPVLESSQSMENKQKKPYDPKTIKTTSQSIFESLNYSLIAISKSNLWANRCLCVLNQLILDWDIASCFDKRATLFTD